MAYETNKLSFILSLPKEINEYFQSAINSVWYILHWSIYLRRYSLFAQQSKPSRHWLMARCWVLKVRMRTASQNLFYFSGQTAKSSPWLRARQNGGNGLDREVMLYDHFRVRSTARSVTIGASPWQVKSAYDQIGDFEGEMAHSGL